jgi:hypothetical protein
MVRFCKTAIATGLFATLAAADVFYPCDFIGDNDAAVCRDSIMYSNSCATGRSTDCLRAGEIWERFNVDRSLDFYEQACKLQNQVGCTRAESIRTYLRRKSGDFSYLTQNDGKNP